MRRDIEAVLWVLVQLVIYAVLAVLIGLWLAHDGEAKGKHMVIPLHRGDIDVLARTLYGEARGEGVAGMQAIAWVVVNRVRKGEPRFKGNVIDVVMAPHQFSCWSKSDPNSKLCARVNESDPIFALAVYAAASVLSGEVRDMVGGADHYHATWMKPFPAWASKMKETKRIGQHVFYKDG